MTLKPFFLVWNPKTEQTAFRHPDYTSARNEALRLAKKNPGQEFFVLGTHCRIVKPPDVQVDEWGMTDLFENEIPF